MHAEEGSVHEGLLGNQQNFRVVDVEQRLSVEGPRPALVSMTDTLQPGSVCACLGLAPSGCVVACPFTDRVARGGKALRVHKPSLKLHRLAAASRAVLGGH